MPLRHFQAEGFRCLTSIAFEVHPKYNLIHGPNASGKTSILEAIAYLGRGKSFRGATAQALISHGGTEFLLHGQVQTASRRVTIAVRNSKDGLDIQKDGDRQSSAAALVATLPLQVVDPEVHSLVAGAPERRRRYLDWIAFHVEQTYPDCWQRFRRALRQRNAALREAASRAAIEAWDREFLEAAKAVDRIRRAALALVATSLDESAAALLSGSFGFEYRQGWPVAQSLGEALASTRESDRQAGTTQVGPHRADLRLNYDQHQAKRLVSRGEQKLLACAMILAATEAVQTALERPLLLLLDDPAAELDEESLGRLMGGVFGLGSQIIATAQTAERLRFPEPPSVFHVEQGRLEKAGHL